MTVIPTEPEAPTPSYADRLAASAHVRGLVKQLESIAIDREKSLTNCMSTLGAVVDRLRQGGITNDTAPALIMMITEHHPELDEEGEA